MLSESILNYKRANISLHFPLQPEAHIAAWQNYLEESQVVGVWKTLRKRLVQLQFPVEQNISQTPTYIAATRRGKEIVEAAEATGLYLQKPENLTLQIYQSIAGPIPVIKSSNHADFVTLVQALLNQNEPVPIPRSIGAYMVSGYTNWDRIRTYRLQWQLNHPSIIHALEWPAEFKRLLTQKHLYQDRFIILTDGPYSGLSAAQMGLPENTWQQLSEMIRLQHECVHYFTKRVLGVMRQDIFDELMADYAGIVAALGKYRADWFLKFMGLESFPHYRKGGRLQNYVNGLTPNSEHFKTIQKYLISAAQNLENFDVLYGKQYRDPKGQALVLLALSHLSLEQLAATQAVDQLNQVLVKIDQISEELFL